LALALAGCQGSDGPTVQTFDTVTTSVTADAPSPSTTDSAADTSTEATSLTAADPTPSGTTTGTTDDGLSDAERADRAAAEAQWVKSWDVYTELPGTPEAERAELASTVMVDPGLTRALDEAKSVSDQGWDTYGAIGHRLSWPSEINGAAEAVIRDCQDTSQTGSYEINTGYKKTVGVPARAMQGLLVKGADGTWRVAQVFYLQDETC
jgi:hypothetical protein